MPRRGWAPNAARQAAAAERDVTLARVIIGTSEVWDVLGPNARQVILNRYWHPGRSWADIAGAIGISKNAAWNRWRAVLARKDVKELTGGTPAAR